MIVAISQLLRLGMDRVRSKANAAETGQACHPLYRHSENLEGLQAVEWSNVTHRGHP